MGENTVYEKIKHFISFVSFKLFLWSIGKTKEQYWNEIKVWENN